MKKTHYDREEVVDRAYEYQLQLSLTQTLNP